MQLASVASLTIVSPQTALNSSSLVISRSACWTRCRRTANTFGAKRRRRSPHHAHSFSASMRTAGRDSDGGCFMLLSGAP